MADNVNFHNAAAFSSSFSVQWDGGETGRTEVCDAGESTEMNIASGPHPAEGTSCWVRAYVYGGPNHDSGRNFTYSAGSGTESYTISGGTLTPSWN